jgi:hypothetical protein
MIETAITLPIMIFLFLAFLAVGVTVQAEVDLHTAVSLAAASAATAPAGDSTTGQAYASSTYTYTIQHFKYLVDSGQFQCRGSWAPTQPVTCRAQAMVLLDSTFVVLPNVTIDATATATIPQYRSAP